MIISLKNSNIFFDPAIHPVLLKRVNGYIKEQNLLNPSMNIKPQDFEAIYEIIKEHNSTRLPWVRTKENSSFSGLIIRSYIKLIGKAEKIPVNFLKTSLLNKTLTSFYNAHPKGNCNKRMIRILAHILSVRNKIKICPITKND
ncbi:MAG: hypothetical protein PHV30_01280 [Candidatus Margulisbacteria bacterium]|nr:hypothetical protein [Candidatus Margulisiibacteriota bacterium]